MRSVLRVASRVCQTDEEQIAYKVIGRAIPFEESEDDVLKMFDVLCGRVTVSALDGIVQFEDISTTSIMNTHWSKAET